MHYFVVSKHKSVNKMKLVMPFKINKNAQIFFLQNT